MFAVKGVYTGEKTVQLESAAPLREGYEVIVTFISPPAQTDSQGKAAEEKDLTERRAAFQRLLKYSGTLHRQIDCKKEMAEYRDARYGHSH